MPVAWQNVRKTLAVFAQMPEKINVSEAHILPGKGVFTGLSRFICARATRARDIMSPSRTGRIRNQSSLNPVASVTWLDKKNNAHNAQIIQKLAPITAASTFLWLPMPRIKSAIRSILDYYQNAPGILMTHYQSNLAAQGENRKEVSWACRRKHMHG